MKSKQKGIYLSNVPIELIKRGKTMSALKGVPLNVFIISLLEEATKDSVYKKMLKEELKTED